MSQARKPLPIKISTLGGGANADLGVLTREQAIRRTEELLARANAAGLEEMRNYLATTTPAGPTSLPLTDSDKVVFLLDRGRWPSQAEIEGWY